MMTAGIYVHVPFCKKKCSYCAFSSSEGNVTDQYLDALKREISGSDYSDLVFDTLFFGGGTPSLLPEGETERIISLIKKRFNTSFKEITFEGNPESFTKKKLLELKAAGVNRISMGVQSLSDECLKKIGRIHSADGARRALADATEIFDNVSADFMLGLPGRTSAEREIESLMEFPLSHVSAYMLTLEENTPLYDAVERGEILLPSEDCAVDEYEAVKTALEARGLARYEVSNFARPGNECAHNLKYWERAPYVGFGPSAHSLYREERFFNLADTEAYCSDPFSTKTREQIKKKEAEFEFVMLGLRLDRGVDLSRFREEFGEDALNRYSESIARVRDKIEIKEGKMRVLPKFTPVLNSILVEFLD